jgi:hypothetical protein
LQVVAEDNGVTIASGNPKAIKGRLFIKANPGDCTLDGILGQVKFNTSITASADYQSGIRGYAELVGGNTVNTGGANANAGSGVYGLRGYITVDDDLTIAASHYIVGCGVQLSVKAAKSVTATGTLAAFGAFADDQAGGATATQKWGVGLYMPSGTVVKAIDATCDAIGATGRIAKLYGSSANAAFTDGYGSVEIDLTLTGTVASTVAASSTWINMGASSSGGSELICVQNNGIYVPSAGTPMASATAIIGMRMQYVTEGGENPGALYLFSTNINANAVTALFHVNAAVDLSWTTGAKSTNAGSIPLFRDVTAGKTWYVNVYDG